MGRKSKYGATRADELLSYVQGLVDISANMEGEIPIGLDGYFCFPAAGFVVTAALEGGKVIGVVPVYKDDVDGFMGSFAHAFEVGLKLEEDADGDSE